MQNPYLALTDEFNRGGLRALLSSGQAVVVHKLAVMSKDGDWILHEDPTAITHVLDVLGSHGARYRFGAPLDLRWFSGGWSAHLEFQDAGLRIRTDFVTRPPRISPTELRGLWAEAARSRQAVVGLVPLAAIKVTNREKDYAVVGELARRMHDPRDRLRWSRSALDLIELARRHPDLAAEVARARPALGEIAAGRDALEAALDRERRVLMRQYEERLAGYRRAAEGWAKLWPEVHSAIERLPLPEAHEVMVQRAVGLLPFQPGEANP